MRFVFNPITSRLEPVAVEGYSYQRIQSLLGCKYTSGTVPASDLHTILFSDPNFFRTYVAALSKVSEQEFLQNLLDELSPQLKPQFKILNREFPYAKLTTDVFRDNTKAIRFLLNPETGLRAFLHNFETQSCELDIAAIQPFPLEIVKAVADGIEFFPHDNDSIPGMLPAQPARFVRLKLDSRTAENPKARPRSLVVHYRLVGTDLVRTADVALHKRFDPVAIRSITRATSNASDFSFLHVDDERKTIDFKPGYWTVDRDLILPAGYRVRVPEGVTLDLIELANLFSRSPLQFRGSDEHPITVHSSDRTGGSVAVLNATEKSTVRHVVFRGLGEPTEPGWAMTGAVSFFESPVDFHDCRVC